MCKDETFEMRKVIWSPSQS